MEPKLEWRQQAIDELVEIVEYIAEDNPDAAQELKDEIEEKAAKLTTSISNLESTSMNLSASRSRILDTDYAKETTNLAKAQIISQAAFFVGFISC